MTKVNQFCIFESITITCDILRVCGWLLILGTTICLGNKILIIYFMTQIGLMNETFVLKTIKIE